MTILIPKILDIASAINLNLLKPTPGEGYSKIFTHFFTMKTFNECLNSVRLLATSCRAQNGNKFLKGTENILATLVKYLIKQLT